MIQKVLIAEDYQSVNLSLQQTMEAMGIADTDYVAYCDDALLRIKMALERPPSYDLLITDLHFEPDHREQAVQNGETLIEKARRLQPDLKVLVFSATGKPATIQRLFDVLDIDGYVPKGRHDATELKLAIGQLAKRQRYYPPQFQKQLRQKAHNFTEFDLAIIRQLAGGMRQKEIPAYLQQNNIRPSGLSSIEKRLNLIKDTFEFSNNEQLIAFCKDNGIL